MISKKVLIHCSGCEERIRVVLSRTQGILKVDPDRMGSKVHVVFEPERVNQKEIPRILEEIGFPVVSVAEK